MLTVSINLLKDDQLIPQSFLRPLDHIPQALRFWITQKRTLRNSQHKQLKSPPDLCDPGRPMPWRWEPIKCSANKNPPDWNDCNSNLSFLVLNKSAKYGETAEHWRGTFRIGKHDSISPRHYPQESCGRVVLEQRHSWRPPIIQDFQPWLSVVKMVDTPHFLYKLRINRFNMLPSTSYIFCSYWALECCLTVLSSCLPIASAKELIASCSAEKKPSSIVALSQSSLLVSFVASHTHDAPILKVLP